MNVMQLLIYTQFLSITEQKHMMLALAQHHINFVSF